MRLPIVLTDYTDPFRIFNHPIPIIGNFICDFLIMLRHRCADPSHRIIVDFITILDSSQVKIITISVDHLFSVWYLSQVFQYVNTCFNADHRVFPAIQGKINK
jgi:hypothetical protein